MSTCEWETPAWLFRLLDEEFHFTLDACARASNAKVEAHFDHWQNALLQSWAGERVFCNPPYNDIDPWARKAWWARETGAVSVLLLPVRSEQRWWHEFVLHCEVRFVRNRLYFRRADGVIGRAPFASAVVVFERGRPARSVSIPYDGRTGRRVALG